jgi:hypothetical protein
MNKLKSLIPSGLRTFVRNLRLLTHLDLHDNALGDRAVPHLVAMIGGVMPVVLTKEQAEGTDEVAKQQLIAAATVAADTAAAGANAAADADAADHDSGAASADTGAACAEA